MRVSDASPERVTSRVPFLEEDDEDDGGGSSSSEECLLVGAEEEEDAYCSDGAFLGSLPKVRGSPVLLAAALLVVVCASCALLVGKVSASTQPEGSEASAERLTPRKLFESHRFADVAVENVFALSSGGVHPSQRGQVKKQVLDGTRNISSRLWTGNPEAGRRLDEVFLTPEEQEGLLKMMMSVRDDRLQKLGRDLSVVVHESLGLSADSYEAEHRVADSLAPRLRELRELRDEVIPPAIRGTSSNELEPEGLSIKPEGIAFMKNLRKWHLEFQMTRAERGAASDEPIMSGRSPASKARRLGSGGNSTGSQIIQMLKMQAQAEKFFNQVQEFMASKYNIHVPNLEEATRGIDVSELISCGMQAVMAANMASAMQCGMEFWTLAMDVIQNVFRSIGEVTTSTQQTAFNNFDDMMN